MIRRAKKHEDLTLQDPQGLGNRSLLVRLPDWKAYLYDLINRIKYYQLINAGLMSFGLSRPQAQQINAILRKHGLIKERLKPRAHRYNLIVNLVYRKLAWASLQEIAVAEKLYPVTYLNVEDLIMEIAQLRLFAEEVGIPATAYRKLSEAELIKAIIAKTETSKSYSESFVAWYATLDDALFVEVESTPGADDGKTEALSKDQAPATTAATPATGDNDIPLEDVLALVDDPDTNLTDLMETCAMVPLLATIDTSKFKDANSLREVMSNKLHGGTEDEPTANEDGVTIEDVIAAVTEASTKEALAEIIDSVPDMFTGFTPSALFPVNKKKALAHLGTMKNVAPATAPADDPNALPFDAATVDIEAEYTGVETLDINTLRKYATKLGITTKGASKESMLDGIATKLQEIVDNRGVAPAAEEASVEINADLINNAVTAGDMDTLNRVAEVLFVTFNALDKRSAERMGAKLIKALPAEGASLAPATAPAADQATATTSTEGKSIYQVIEELVKAGQTVEQIIGVVTPHYTNLGKAAVFIKKRITGLVEVIRTDHNMDKKK